MAPQAVAAREMSLTEKSIAAAKWNYLGVLARIVVQFGVQIALARLLGPDALGLFALVLLLIGLGGIVVELGLGAALVQRREVSDNAMCVVATRSVFVALVLCAGVLVFAPQIATALGDGRLITLLRAITPVFILQALAVAPTAVLRRELAFKAIQAVQLSSYIVGFLVVGVGMALFGAGVWSLVAAWLVTSALAAIGVYALRRHSLRPRFFGHDEGTDRFANRVFVTNLANWTIDNVDNLIVGRLFGAVALGLYSVSYTLVRTPTNHLVTTLQSVLFAASARAQDNPDNVRRAYLVVTAAVALAVVPTFVGVAIVSDTLVSVLFGARWTDASPILIPLSLAMIFHAIMAVSGPVLLGVGVPSEELKVQALTAVLLVSALLFAASFSVAAMSWAVFAVYIVRWLAMTAAVRRRIDIGVGAILRSLRGGGLVGGVLGGSLWAIEMGFPQAHAGLRLAIEIGSAVVGFGVIVYFYPALALSAELAAFADGALREVRIAARWIGRLRATSFYR